MIQVTAVDAVDEVGYGDADIAEQMQRNISTAQLLSEAEHQELLQWAVREEGPWRDDLSRYPGPLGAALGRQGVAAAGAAERGEEPYRPSVHGYDCELFRNEFLAWCGAVQLPQGHPDFGKRPNELNGHLKVHGGLAIADVKSGRLEFDCNHGTTDLIPYSVFASAGDDRRRTGALAAPPPRASGKGSGGLLRLPGTGCGLPAVPQRLATYKDYAFARKELEALVEQLRAREIAAP
mmetsp:Transcript_83204/g.231571  ORF Transcript_83204/g.231571 Transcript_83204/m.231571 type:complete len:236 (+) Transcript_83204:20-727(+)